MKPGDDGERQSTGEDPAAPGPTVTASDLRRRLAEVLDLLERGTGSVLVTRRDRPAAVLLSVRAYASLQRELATLRALALGELESAGGAGHTLDEVLADCDLLLEQN